MCASFVVMVCTWLVLACHVKAAVANARATETETRDIGLAEAVEGTRISSRPGRHVCTAEKTISRPVPVLETYRKPVYKPRARIDCQNPFNCPQFDVEYELANRTVYHLQKSSTFQHNCCPGWTKGSPRDKGCMTPICSGGCGDFGVCVRPEVCECRRGYGGAMCDTDIDECQIPDHGCQHSCRNTAGSYMCACQQGFNLEPDGKSCRYCFACQEEFVQMRTALELVQSQLVQFSQQQDLNVPRYNEDIAARIDRLENELANVTREKAELHTLNVAMGNRIDQLEASLQTMTQDKLQSLDDHQQVDIRLQLLEQGLINITQGQGEVRRVTEDVISRIEKLEEQVDGLQHGMAEMHVSQVSDQSSILRLLVAQSNLSDAQIELTRRIERQEQMLESYIQEQNNVTRDGLDDCLAVVETRLGNVTADMMTSHRLYEELNLKMADMASHKEEVGTYQKLLEGKMAEIEETLTNVTSGKAEFIDHLTNLQQELLNASQEKNVLVGSISQMMAAYDDVMAQISVLQNQTTVCQRTCEEGRDHVVTQDDTSPTPGESQDTVTPTEDPFAFDPVNMIYSLSNQIGLMEEKLDLCKCHERSPYN